MRQKARAGRTPRHNPNGFATALLMATGRWEWARQPEDDNSIETFTLDNVRVCHRMEFGEVCQSGRKRKTRHPGNPVHCVVDMCEYLRCCCWEETRQAARQAGRRSRLLLPSRCGRSVGPIEGCLEATAGQKQRQDGQQQGEG